MKIRVDRWTGDLHQELSEETICLTWDSVAAKVREIVEAGDLANVMDLSVSENIPNRVN